MVTLFYPQRRQLFVQDDTGGVFVYGQWNRNDLKSGDLVEVRGVTDQGAFAPLVVPNRVTPLGTAPLPAARKATLFQLATGQYDGQWIEAHGVVRSSALEDGLLRVKINDPDGALFVYVPAENAPTNLVDAVVRVRGVCSARPNAKHQISSLVIWSPSLDWMQIEDPGVADPMSLPTHSIASLSQFRPHDLLPRRVKIAGVVTLCQDAQTFFVQDGSDGIQVIANSATNEPHPGDQVEVAGYPTLGDEGNVLSDGLCRVLNHSEVPAPHAFASEHALDPLLQNRRVQTTARLLNYTPLENMGVLTLQIPGWIFEGHCLAPLDGSQPPPPGSTVRLTGIYRVVTDEARAPSSFQILASSWKDIEIVSRPPWFTLERSLVLVGLMALVIAATALWVMALRRRVHERTASLQESEIKFRSLVEESLVGVYVIQNGRFVYVNPRQAAMFGYSPEEMLSFVTVEETILPEDWPRVQEQMRRRMEGAVETTHYTFRGRRKDGSVVHVEVLGSASHYAGKPAAMGTSLDVTERKRSEEALAEASTLLETLLGNSPDHIYFKDLESRFVHSSRSFSSLLDAEKANALRGKTDFDIFSEEHARIAYEDEQHIIRTGESIVGHLEKETHRDGRTTWALTNKQPWRDKDGNIIGTFGISKDVTAIKEAEQKLAYERELFQTLLDTIPDTIYFKDLESRFVRVSKSKVRRSLPPAQVVWRSKLPEGAPDELPPGLRTEEEFSHYIIGRTDFDMLQETCAQGAWEEEQTIIRTGTPLIGKLRRLPLPDGSNPWLLITKLPWRDTDGRIIGTFGVSSDVTALKEAEARLEEAHQRVIETSRLAGMAEVATDVLHNVGNVLNSVNVSGSLIIDRVRNSRVTNLTKVSNLLHENQERLADFFVKDARGRQVPAYLAALAEYAGHEQTSLLQELEQLIRHIDHIKQIVAMQQNYARVAGVLETISPAQMVDDALHINAAALKRHKVHVRREFGDVPAILTEKHKVLQILVNLIRNAKYAVHETGRPDGELTMRLGSDGNGGIQIQAIDNGVGIPPENLTRIFSHGFTTRPDGHGFGLHSSALAVRELGGSLSAHSDGPGRGAVFTLVLPHEPPQPTV